MVRVARFRREARGLAETAHRISYSQARVSSSRLRAGGSA